MKKIFSLALFGFLLAINCSASATRTVDADSIKSSDHTKTYSLPAATDTLVGRASTDTLTNKSMSGASNTFTNIPADTALVNVLGSSHVSGKTTLNSQSGTTYTLVLSDGVDAGGFTVVHHSNASAITTTVPTNASVAFPVGDLVQYCQMGAGKVTFSPAGGVTINSKGGNLSIGGQYVCVTLQKTATNTWLLIGDLIP